VILEGVIIEVMH